MGFNFVFDYMTYCPPGCEQVMSGMAIDKVDITGKYDAVYRNKGEASDSFIGNCQICRPSEFNLQLIEPAEEYFVFGMSVLIS